MKTPGPQSSCREAFGGFVNLTLESTLKNFSTASFTFLRLCLIFLGLVYVFFLRFFPPPANSRFRKTVDSSSTPHSASTWATSRVRPPKDRHCSAAGTPQAAATCCCKLATSRRKICILAHAPPSR